MKRRIKGMVTMCVYLLGAWFVAAQSISTNATGAVPRLVKFSGFAKDNAGHVRVGVVGVTFALYKDQEGGTPLWLETQNVQAGNKGSFTVLLGSTKTDGLPAELFSSNESRWLGVQVEGQSEQPRVLFVSVPYALKAVDAETIGGLPPSAFVRANVDGTNSAASSDGHQGASVPASGAHTAASNSVPPATVNVITASPGATSGFVSVWTGSSPSHTLGSSVLFQNSSKQLGVNTKTPGASLEVDSTNQLGIFNNAPFTGVGAGLQFHTTGTGGKGWEILNTGSTAAQGPSKLNIRDLSTNADVFTIAPGGLVGIGNTSPATVLQVTDHNVVCCSVSTVLAADAFTVSTAIFGDATSTSELTEGVFGQVFSSTTSTAGVEGEAQATSGLTYGVSGFNRSGGTFSAGVAGGSESSSGVTFGVTATSASPNGTGALGLAQGESSTASGILGCCPVGVWGDTRSSAAGAAGLVGTADDARAILLQNNSPSGVPTAFMFQGASGKFALLAGGAGGECTIDTNGALFCPGGVSAITSLDAGRKVALYAVQSPQHWFEDFGSGQLAGGAASVTLEHNFAETVSASDYHVFLTPEGDCRGLYVSDKTATGFEVHEIGAGKSSVPFSYRIVALRRGFENVRMEDMTERLAQATAPQPKAAAATRFTLPTPPPAPKVSGTSTVVAQSAAQRN